MKTKTSAKYIAIIIILCLIQTICIAQTTCPSINIVDISGGTNAFTICAYNSGPYSYRSPFSHVSSRYNAWFINNTFINQDDTVNVQGVNIHVIISGSRSQTAQIWILNNPQNALSSFNLGLTTDNFRDDDLCSFLETSQEISIVQFCGQVIQFNSLDSKQCGDAPFYLNATSSSGLPITYTSSNPAIASINENIVTINGIGTAEITAFQEGGSSYSAATPVTKTLTVNGITAAISSPLSSGSILNVCSADARLIASPGGDYSYTWSNGQHDQVIYISESGTYSVTIQNTITGCTSSASVTVNVLQSPTPSINGPNTVAAPSSIGRYSTDAGMQNYWWSTSSGGQPYAAPIKEWQDTSPPTYITYPGTPASNDKDNYPVIWTYMDSPQLIGVSYIDNNGCYGRANMEIKYLQEISFSLSTKQCGDTPFYLNATSSSGLPITYTSSNPAIASINENIVTINGIGTAEITAFQEGGSSYSAATPVTKTLTVNGITAAISSPLSSGSILNVCSADARLIASPGGDYSYTWSNGQHDQVIYISESGTYSVTIQNTITGCTSSASVTVNVLQSPTPSINGPNTVAAPSSIGRYSTDAGMQNYWWSTSSGGQPYAAPIKEWQDTSPPTYITYPGTPASNDKDNYPVIWTYMDSPQLIGVSYIDNNGCYGRANMEIKYKYNQNISFQEIPSLCQGTSWALSANSNSGLPITFASSDPSIAVISGNTIKAINPGTVSIVARQEENSNFFAASTSQTFIVNPTPVDATITASNTSICLGQSVTISSSGGVGTPYYWGSSNGGSSWDVFSGEYAGKASFSYQPTKAGTYRFHVRNQTACGFCWDIGNCPTYPYVDVSVSNAEININPAGPVILCSDNSVTLSASFTSSSARSDSDMNSSFITPTSQLYWSTGVYANSITVSNPGTYTVSGYNSLGCFATKSVVVKVFPGDVLISSSGSLCNNGYTKLTASGGGNYYWSNGSTSASITVYNAGTYTVKVTSNGCSKSVSTYIAPCGSCDPCSPCYQSQKKAIEAAGGRVMPCTKSIQQAQEKEPIIVTEPIIFPNPANNEITVSMPDKASSDVPIKIIDQTGTVMSTSDIKESSNFRIISTTDFPNGFYIVEFGLGKVLIRKKIIIMHSK